MYLPSLRDFNPFLVILWEESELVVIFAGMHLSSLKSFNCSMFFLVPGIGIIGAIRLFNLPLFKAKSSKFEQFKIDKNAKVREDDSGYVIELFPSKSR